MLKQITRRALAVGFALTPALVMLVETAGWRSP
jgi:hypothetical protein